MGEIGALLGRVVAGKFKIEEHVGGGAMGEVFRARHVVLDTAIALKIMRPDIAKDAMFKERFYREAKAASRLDHPNSVRVIDFGTEPDGLVYLAMEFLHGRDLLSVLREEWPLPDERIVDLLVQTLGAVSVAHDLGIVHRDLKPENIMVSVGHDDEGTRPYHVKVCDFGIAKINDPRGFQTDGAKALTSSGTLIGTPEYMSPEQARGDPLDARSDVYSVGIILYQLLVGRVPFSAENALGVVLKQVTDEPVPPSRLRPGVNLRLEAICLRALKKSRDERHQSAKEMRRELRAVLGQRPTSLTDESGTHLPARPRFAGNEDATSAPTIIQAEGGAIASPVVSAKNMGGDFASKETSDGTELTVPLHGSPRWLGILAAAGAVALLVGAASVIVLARAGKGDTVTTGGSASASAAPAAAASIVEGEATSTAPMETTSAVAVLGTGAPLVANGRHAPPVTAKQSSGGAGAVGAAGTAAATSARAAAASPVASGAGAAARAGAGAGAGPGSGAGGGATAAASDPPYNPTGAYVALGALSRERVREDVIRAKMSAALPQLSECYRTSLVMMGAPVGGSAEIHMSIDDKGNVTTFVNAPKLPPFARCAQRALGTQKVPVSALESTSGGATASQWLTLHP